MKIYVASKYEEKQRVRKLFRQLRRAGHEISYDWTQNEPPTPDAQAWNDKMGIRDADAFVLIAEKDLAYCGALVELGIALGYGIPVYVVGHALDARCVFLHLPEIHRSLQPLLLPRLETDNDDMEC